MKLEPRPSRRAWQTAQTRESIMAAMAQLVERSPHQDITIGMIAEHLGITERTVYRHFPSREQLVDAFAEWIGANLVPVLPLERLEALPLVFTQGMRFLDERPNLAQAMLESRVGREVFTGFHAALYEQLSARLDERAPGLDAAQRRRALAALRYLDNIFAWSALRDEFGMAADEMGAVIGWVMNLVIDHLDAPAPAQGSDDD